MRADFHTHSRFSFDGAPDATVSALCEAALARGLTHLAVTDHVDINGEIEGFYPVLDKEGVFAEVQAAKARYAGRLHLLFGVELGQATQYPREAAALLARYPYDIVLGSLHNLAGERDFWFLDFTDEAQYPDARLADYFGRVIEESETLVDFPGIHVLTHLTYLHRYVLRAGRTLDFSPFREKLLHLFRRMASRGVALEVNTSTLAEGRGVTMPPAPLLALYREAGGRLLSVGSDAHAPGAVAQCFDRAASLLADCGFTALSVPTAHGLLTLPVKEDV